MRNAIIATAAGLTLLTAACSSSTTSGTPAGGPVATKPSAAGSASTGPAAPGGAVTPAATQGGGSGQDANSWCQELERAGNVPIVGGGDGLSAAQIAKAEQLANDAPSDIRPDVQKLIEADKAMLTGHPSADESQAVVTAGSHVVTWLQSNCPDLMNKLNPGLGSALPTG